MIPEIQQLYQILSSFLGEAKNGFDGKCMQLQFPCPCCIESKGEQERLKFNLEVNLQMGVFHCWSCQADDEDMHGNVLKLIHKYGNDSLVKDYIKTLESIRKSEIYKIKFSDTDFQTNSNEALKQTIDFPTDYIPIIKGRKVDKRVQEYLDSRGITQDIITRFNIGYTTFCNNEKQRQWSFRIVLPSYNEFGELNYCVGRDYTDKSKNKYFNAKADKKKMIFNEEKVQWDADITLVEGPFDHIVVPNSIPLLGKHLDMDCKIYQSIMERANANVNIWCDGDAHDAMLSIYKLLNSGRLKGKIRYIPTKPKNDPSFLFQIGGYKSIIEHLSCAQEITT